MNINLSFPFLVLTGITGCTTQNIPLTQDSSSTSTKVRFVSLRETGWIDLYPETDCNNGARVVFDNPVDNFIEPLRGHTPRRVGMIDSPDPTSWEAAEFSFKGGQTINIAVSPVPGRCLGGVSFQTEPGSQYEAVLISSALKECEFEVSKLTFLNNLPHREPVQKVGPLICE